MDLDRFSELFVTGDLYFGDYLSHVLGWLEPRGPVQPDQLVALRYEDMVEDKPGTLETLRAALFPEVQLDPQQAIAIAASTGFDAMKQALTAHPGSFHLNPSIYFRAGTTDDWRQHLSPAAEAR
ncbi:MAG: sulfotransferase domain-containing protein, partial [bacterium]